MKWGIMYRQNWQQKQEVNSVTITGILDTTASYLNVDNLLHVPIQFRYLLHQNWPIEILQILATER